MKTVFARALPAFALLAIVALPASAFASSKTTHSHSEAKKEPKKKAVGKHHHGAGAGHKTASSKTHAAAPDKAS